MKKTKIALTMGVFALALVSSFAFKPAAHKYSAAFIKNAAAVCVTTTCPNGSNILCTILGKQAYVDANCTIPAFRN